MSLRNRLLCAAPAILAAVGCAKANQGGDGDASVSAIDAGEDDIDGAGCGEFCDDDNDGVVDGVDQCASTPTGEVVNPEGCSDSQVDPTLAEPFPPFGLTWVPAGDLGRAGGLTWTYTGIQRTDLFHVYWVVCDDPATPCGMSLDGLIDQPSEHWQFNSTTTNLAGGVLAFQNTTHIVLADTSTVTLGGRLTVTIKDGAGLAIPFATMATLGITGRDADYGAEIPATAYTVVALAEVYDSTTSTWVPYLDYYDAAPTADPGLGTGISFGGSVYGE